MRTSAPALRRQRAFTLVEMVAVMVITGILATMVFSFIRIPVGNYLAGVARAAAVDAADTSMRRMTRDLRLALPNSIRQSGDYLEYLETKAGLRYLGDDDSVTPGGVVLSWDDASATTFTVVGGIPGGRLLPTTSDAIVIYNLGTGQEPANAYDCSSACNRTLIAAVDPTLSTLRMSSNVFAAQSASGVALKSPAKRFHVITGPVTYGCDSVTGRLTRYWDYPIAAVQASARPAGAKSAILAENLTACSFSYATMANQRSGLINIRLALRVQDENNGTVSLHHQVHVNNTP